LSQKANYFKLGLFVIGAIVAGVAVLLIIGSGRWLKPHVVMETYFNESVQGLDIGSKMKYRGVVIGEVTRISFTYTKYELDRPMSQRKRYVLVEAQLEPRLVGGRVANDIASPASVKIEVERGLRVHLAPQGIWRGQCPDGTPARRHGLETAGPAAGEDDLVALGPESTECGRGVGHDFDCATRRRRLEQTPSRKKGDPSSVG